MQSRFSLSKTRLFWLLASVYLCTWGRENWGNTWNLFFFFLTYCMPIGSSLTAARRFCGDYEKKHIGFLPYVGSKENQGVTQLGCLTNRLTLEQEKDIQWYKSAHIPSIFSNQQYFLLVQQYTFQDETCQFWSEQIMNSHWLLFFFSSKKQCHIS